MSKDKKWRNDKDGLNQDYLKKKKDLKEQVRNYDGMDDLDFAINMD